MKGDAKVIEYLNKVLKNELTIINQYFLHARMYQNWGLEELNEHEYQASVAAMKHADRLIERTLFLEGLPNLQDLGKLLLGQDVEEMLDCDLKMAQQNHALLKETIAYCESCGDYVSRELFESIEESEEGHIHWLEIQLGLIKRVGLQNYQQSMMS